jgi:hypothetical protein
LPGAGGGLAVSGACFLFGFASFSSFSAFFSSSSVSGGIVAGDRFWSILRNRDTSWSRDALSSARSAADAFQRFDLFTHLGGASALTQSPSAESR